MDHTPKTYTMLQTVRGSRDGITVETFAKGSTHRDLPPDLVEQFYHLGAIDEATGRKATGPRENKMTAPAENKAGEAGVPLSTQHVEELVSLARDTYGLDVDSNMDEATLRQMIADAEADEGGEKTDLSKLTKRALVIHAESLGLALDEASKKDDLIAAIQAHTA